MCVKFEGIMKSEFTIAAGVAALLLSVSAQGVEGLTREELKASRELEALIREGLIEFDPVSGRILVNDQILEILRNEGRLTPILIRDSDICGKIDG